MQYRAGSWQKLILGFVLVTALFLEVIGTTTASVPKTTPLAKAVEPVQDGFTLIPLPQSVEWLEGNFMVKAGVPIVIADNPSPAEKAAARDVATGLSAFGVTSQIVHAAEVPDVTGAIVIGQPDSNPWVLRLLSPETGKTEQLPSEGYQLLVTPDVAVVSGADASGSYWGAQTLLQLLVVREEGVFIRGVRINDWPDFAVRALHMFPSSESDSLHLKIITNLMPQLKLNTLILQVEQSRWESHPELWTSDAADKDTLARLAEAAREHNIEVIPLVNLFGHMEWAFRGGNNLSFCADPTKEYAYDPFNPESIAFAKEILNEVIELFHPRYVHIGHDEVRMRGSIPTQGHPFGQVFVDEIKDLHDYLASRGVGTMIWADEALKSDVYPYLSQLPKDIVMVYWNYGTAATYPDIGRLQRLGFPVWAAVWYDPENISALSRSAKKYAVKSWIRCKSDLR